ncbi:unnamed protein product [Blepharisma stoltei]|uniref:Uncharacterized protein n=1 Tax=Blepharisma stoltei TaxID=1481888 RepID=A0AAU9JWN0_9CILI|nr:unnamed protein product [Blepharisma stoltei]
MNSSNIEDKQLSDQNVKLSFLKEELIEMNYDVRLFTKFVEDLRRTNVDEWSFDELSDCIWAFKNKYKPGQTLEEVVEKEKVEKEIEKELYEIVSQKKNYERNRESDKKNRDIPPKPEKKIKFEENGFESSPKYSVSGEEYEIKYFIDEPIDNSSEKYSIKLPIMPDNKQATQTKIFDQINSEHSGLFLHVDDPIQESVTPQFSRTEAGYKFSTLSSSEEDILAEIYGKNETPSQSPEEESIGKSSSSMPAFNTSLKNPTLELNNEKNTQDLTTVNHEDKGNIRKDDEGILRYFQSFTSTLEKFEEKLEKLSSRISDIEFKIDKNSSDYIEKNKILAEEVQALTNEIKDIKKSNEIVLNSVEMIKELPEKVNALENKDKYRSKLLEELASESSSFRENSKDLESKIDKLEIGIKNKLKNLKNNSMSRNEISDIRESQSSITANIENLTSDIYHANEEIMKLRNQMDTHLKSSIKISKLKADHEKFYNEISQKIENLEQKDEEVKKIRVITETIKSDLSEKLKSLEEKIRREHENDPAKEATLYSISTLEKKMQALDEKLAKELASVRDFSISNIKEYQNSHPEESKAFSEKADVKIIFQSENATKKQTIQEKNSPLTISQLEKDQLSKPTVPRFFYKTKNKRVSSSTPKLKSYQPESFPQTVKNKNIEEEKILNVENEHEPIRDLPISNKRKLIDRELLNERITRLENLNKRAVTTEVGIQSVDRNSECSVSGDLGDFVPGETESILVSTILEKANKARATDSFKQLYRPFKGISPLSSSMMSISQYSQKQSTTNSEFGETLPSQELQEHLKLRGFNIKESKPFVSRQKDL